MVSPRQALTLLRRETIPVTGCTEPACIAFAVAAARARLRRNRTTAPLWVTLALSREVYRNAATATVPFIRRRGIAAAAAAGLFCRPNGFNPFRGLLARLPDWRARLRRRNWLTIIPLRRSGLLVRATVSNGCQTVTTLVSGRHDQLRTVYIDGNPIYRAPRESMPRLRHLAEIAALAARRDPGLERFACSFLRRQVRGAEGTPLPRQVASLIRRRMSGDPLNVLTFTGSGNQGLFLVLPLRELWRRRGNAAIPAIVFTLLVQVWLTQREQRLAKPCGLATKAGPALAAGFAFAAGKPLAEITREIRRVKTRFNTMACPGAMPGCARKAERLLRWLLPRWEFLLPSR